MKPIKIVPAEIRNTNIVEWMIGNTCNFNCSFCPNEFKSGDRKWFDFAVYQSIINKIIKESQDKKVWFKISGGEPSLYPKLIELLRYIKDQGHYTYLITNGSRTMRYWKEVKDAQCIDLIAFTYHPEQTSDIDHMVKVIDLFLDVPTITIVNITCLPSKFKEAVEAYQTFYTQCNTYVSLQQINDSEGLSKYTPGQLKIVQLYGLNHSESTKIKTPSNIPVEYKYHNGQVKYIYSDGRVRQDHSNNFIKQGEDNFAGYKCYSGITNLRIDYDNIQRAVCGIGEKWSVSSPTLFKTSPVICTQNTCTCSLDIILPKEL